MFLTIYMHQFGWLSERGGNFFNLLQKEGGTQKGGGVASEKGGSNPGGNHDKTQAFLFHLKKKIENGAFYVCQNQEKLGKLRRFIHEEGI